MTHLRAAAIATDVLGRDTAASTNPERDFAEATQDQTGGLVAWFRNTALGKALTNRKAERELADALLRLAETSPHLLDDIGMADSDLVAPGRYGATQTDAVVPATHRAPVPLRPALRPRIVALSRAPAPVAAKQPTDAARPLQPSAQ
jgi:hypothetical protein